MLERLRGAVKSWVAQVLLGLLVLSFAVWGVGDIAGGFSTKVATVGEQEIEAELYANVLRREQQRFGIDPSEIRSSGLDRFVLARMIREAAFEDQMRRLGVSAPDSAVAAQARAEAAFQVGGQFDATQYANSVRRAFGTVAAYEETVRRALASGLLMAAASEGAQAPPRAGAALARRSLQTRRFEALILDAARHAPEPDAPDDAALAQHLRDNADAFTRPERRDATWLHVDPVAMAESIDIDEAELRALYAARSEFYVTPETREIDQIVYADEATARDARARLDAGEADFDALLAERGLSRADAALGPVTRADLRGDRAEAAFALDAPGVAGPARLPTGYALLDVRAIAEEVAIPFEAARAELRREIGADMARPDADRLAEEIEDLRAGGATLEEVAAELGLETGGVEGVTRAGIGPDGARVEGVAARDAVLAEIFDAEQGAERDMLRLQDGGYAVVRVDAVAPAATPALDEIRAAVAEDWARARRRDALAEIARAALERIEAGETLERVALDFDAAPVALGPLRRDDPDPRLSAEARDALFSAEPGAAALSLSGQRAVIAVLREVIEPESVAREAAQLDAALAQSIAQDQLEYLGRALEAEAGATVNERAADSVISGVGG